VTGSVAFKAKQLAMVVVGEAEDGDSTRIEEVTMSKQKRCQQHHHNNAVQ
jgi:hypothetical protein